MTKMKAFTLAEVAKPHSMLGNVNKSAFTLAEVLITLGIIGVVAAMTMPTLMNSTNGAQYKTAYKKALSVLSQAVVMNIALDDYDFSQASEEGVDATKQSLYAIFKNRMNVVGDSPVGASTTHKVLNPDKMPVAGICKTSAGEASSETTSEACTKTAGNKWTALDASGLVTDGFLGSPNSVTLKFNDGITFTFDTKSKNCTAGSKNTGAAPCFGLIDVNGEKSPNKIVECDKKVVAGGACIVTNPSDIYPVTFYDQTILPMGEAATAVLYGK